MFIVIGLLDLTNNNTKTLSGNKSIFPFILLQVTSHLVIHITFIDNINNIATKAKK